MTDQPDEPTIDQKVAIFEEAGNGPEATAEYRASLEQTASAEAAEEVATAVAAAPFAQAVTILRSGSGTEDKFAAIADLFEQMGAEW